MFLLSCLFLSSTFWAISGEFDNDCVSVPPDGRRQHVDIFIIFISKLFSFLCGPWMADLIAVSVQLSCLVSLFTRREPLPDLLSFHRCLLRQIGQSTTN